jgi:signal peptidase
MTSTLDTTAARVAMLRGAAHGRARHDDEHVHHDHLVHVTPHATGRRHVLHDVLDLLLLGIIVVGVWFLWPVNFGGSARFIIVEGKSMEPTFHLGDAVVVKTIDNPKIGDIVVFQVPKGEPGGGSLVVHRLYGIRDDGSFITKGDNRRYPDPFHVRQENILGTPTWTLPQFGRFIISLGNPYVLGGAIGLIFFVVILPKSKDEKGENGDDAKDRDAVIGGPEPAPTRSVLRLHSVDDPTLEMPRIDPADAALQSVGASSNRDR